MRVYTLVLSRTGPSTVEGVPMLGDAVDATPLDAAALEAVQQWTFTPTRLNGDPVPVVLTVTVVFSLR